MNPPVGTALRSHLYVPGDRPDVLRKAVARGADALIIDLEDAVAASAKDTARRVVADFLAERVADGTPALWVRINPAAAGRVDLKAVVSPAISGICIAKAESVDAVAECAALVDALERERGIPSGRIALSPLLESAAAVFAARDIASAPRVVRLQVGEADLRADIGVTPGPDERELLWVRSQVVLASAAAGIEPPVGPVSTNFTDPGGLRESTLALQRLGYLGRACIHPNQLAVVNEVFTPSDDEVEKARVLIARYEAASASGEGVFVDESGRMVDFAVVRSARRTLAAARQR
ncbi:HpcH/HpaI aldolase/citrate lyase family protein [Yinghuangia seranimata]|uniref:HpcH/HpaI aldolase/citrate lyase family protein n=1 Tax=Yinghuangia seranimata TaxID=408067 RepID=UPI00248C4CC6|nr:CoA ester lyase [Yinghuangia seranimata]MDI2132445.1 CoA ester lyase [Yinghuangia seranimata]